MSDVMKELQRLGQEFDADKTTYKPENLELEHIAEIEARVRATICQTFGSRERGGPPVETRQGRILADDFEALLRYAQAGAQAMRDLLASQNTAMETFTVYRRLDISATHTKDQVNPPDEPQFEGVVFSDGTVAIKWLTAVRSCAVFPSLDDLKKIHGHPEYGSEWVWHNKARAVLKVKP